MRIRREAALAMVDHARREYPLECCGLLWGRGKVIEGIEAAGNEKKSRIEFRMSPSDLIAAMKVMRQQNRDFLGIYHSHPDGPAEPSKRDAEEFHYREASYWIVSMISAEPVLRCYRWRGGGFEPVRYRTV